MTKPDFFREPIIQHFKKGKKIKSRTPRENRHQMILKNQKEKKAYQSKQHQNFNILLETNF
ncbi:hypothetical protein BpHYR1_031594 [Brachionus plicatilis]|uniref:Uncharacterized protein n=1 Tax=Brachionus plicatilis TaxID=10195 RepID=A0A3M7SZX8_BRAPC|nr:hypothetical protein BpHYR1_031594 [Brachionus plicatilis]